MTIIKTNHLDCGDIELDPSQVRLTDGPRPFYGFRCPVCTDWVTKDAEDQPSEPQPNGAESSHERAGDEPFWSRIGFHPNMPESRGNL